MKKVISLNKKKFVLLALGLLGVISITIAISAIYFRKNLTTEDDIAIDRVVSSSVVQNSLSLYELISSSNAEIYYVEKFTPKKIALVETYEILSVEDNLVDFEEKSDYMILSELNWFTILTDVEVYESKDGSLYVVLELEEGSIKSIYIYNSAKAASIDVKDEPVSSPANDSIIQSEITLYTEFSDDGKWIVEEGQEQYGHYYVYAVGLSEAECEAFAVSKDTGEIFFALPPYDKKFGLSNPGGYPEIISFYLPSGKHDTTINCEFGGEVYTSKAEMEMVVSPKSICDEMAFELNLGEYTFEEASDLFVGEWNGCTDNPWEKPYEVYFEFRADGSYSARNIEIDKNPTTSRQSVALYYGITEDSELKQYEIIDQNINGTLEGQIAVDYGYEAITGELRNIKISEDGRVLYMEFFHRGIYGPIQYILTRK